MAIGTAVLAQWYCGDVQIRSVIALTVVCGSACIALETQLASETQAVAVVNVDNPYVFTVSQQPHTFKVTTASSTEIDDVTGIRFDNAFGCQNFRLVAPTLPAHICGGSAFQSGCATDVAFDVTYTGTGTESCNVAIDWTGGSGSGSGVALAESGTSYLRLSSDVSAPSLSVAPAAIDFGQIGSNTPSAPQVVTVTNTGNVALFVNPAALGAIPTAFTVTPAASLVAHMLAVGSAENYTIVCTPPAATTYSAALRFTAGSIVKMANFTCQGVTSGIGISPNPVAFMPTLVGKAPPDQTVTITGGSATKISSVTLDATAVANNVVIRNPPMPDITIPSSGVPITLHYAADKPHDTGPLGKLIIRASSDSQPREVTINGQALVGSIGTNPANVDFGPVCVNTTAVRDVEVFANAAGAVVLSRPDPPGAPFAFAASTGLPVTLQGNHVGGTTLRIAAMPTSAGEFSATLQLPTDIPGGQPYPLPIQMNAAPRGVGATPQVLQFGSVGRNTSTSGREVTLTNCGPDKLTVTAASITGTDPGEFVIAAPSNPAVTLQPTEYLTFLVVMSAHDVIGDKSALLHIEHSGGTTDVQLQGSVGAASTTSKDRETYYGCRIASGSSSGLPGALVVMTSLVMARRRRRR